MITEDMMFHNFVIKLNQKIIGTSDDIDVALIYYRNKRNELIEKHKINNSKKDILELINIDTGAILEQNEII